MRRAIMLFALLLLASMNVAAAGGGVAYIINSRGPNISVVDMATLRETGTIPMLREPHHVMPTPDGKSLMFGDTVGNEMVFIDPNTGAVQKRIPMADPYQFGFSPDRKWFVVNGLGRNQVDVYDAATFQLVKRFPAKSTPSHLAYKPDSSVVYVSLQDLDRAMAIDLKKMDVMWNEPIGKTPAGVLWQNNEVLVALMGTDHLVRLDPATGHVLGHVTTGEGAHNLFLSPDHKIVWVNNRAGGTTTALDAATLKIIRTYKIPGGPDDIDFAPDGKLWITRRFAEKVAVLDPATGAYETVQVGRSPHGLFLNGKGPSPAVAAR